MMMMIFLGRSLSALYLHPNGGPAGVADMRLSLTDKMLLLPSGGGGGGVGGAGGGNGSAHHHINDPRRTYLETVLQDSLVQQSYTIVLPSHLPISADQLASHTANANLLGAGCASDAKAWNLAGSGKNNNNNNSATSAVAELQCLQGLFAARGAAGSRASLVDEDSKSCGTVATNLTTNKNANHNNNNNHNSSCGSSSSSNSKRNGKEGYSCHVCRKMFTSSSNLAVHSMIHSGTKPFKCDLCSWSFRQKAHLQKHMRHIHKIIVAK